MYTYTQRKDSEIQGNCCIIYPYYLNIFWLISSPLTFLLITTIEPKNKLHQEKIIFKNHLQKIFLNMLVIIVVTLDIVKLSNKSC